MRKIQKRIVITFLSLAIILNSCKSDDSASLISQEERNELDDEAIEKYLKEHYFAANGKVEKCTNGDCTAAGKIPLKNTATKDTNGYWYVLNPAVTATGATPTSTEDNIVMQYQSYYFVSTEVNGLGDYGTPTASYSTINESGVPVENPFFWKKELTEAELALEIKESYYEMPGVQMGLLNFNSTLRSTTALPAVNFQGLIIVPSRLAYGRNSNLVGFGTDYSFILNFEMYRVNS